jgi:hypothetical protein
MLCQLRFHCLDDDLNYHYCQMFKILIPPGESKFHDISKEKHLPAMPQRSRVTELVKMLEVIS